MDYRQTLRESVTVSGEASERVQALIDDLAAAFDQGGEKAVTAALERRLKDIHQEFERKRAALKAIL